MAEDTEYEIKDIRAEFGDTVADIVDGATKISDIFKSHEVTQAESYRKMLLSMSRDLRVIFIKLADRLHNMRTLDAVVPAKRRRVARETMEIYAPIANRLGLNAIYQELEDLSFNNIYPMRSRVLTKAVKAARGNRREVVGRVLEAIRKKLDEAGAKVEVK